MEHLASGCVAFRRKIFPERRELFEELAEVQSPLALFITRSDSRIDPDLVTQRRPGDGKVQAHGWTYDIETEEICCDHEARKFQPLTERKTLSGSDGAAARPQGS